MKYLYSYIVFLFLLFNNSVAGAQKITLPTDFEGVETLAQVERVNADEKQELSFEQVSQIVLEIGSYFYNKYTVEDIFSDDFADKVRPFFPDDSESELESKIELLRFGVSVYVKAKEAYNDYVKKRLLPDVYRKVKSPLDYDHPDEVPYIEAEPGYFVKVNNFKKFLTYSNNKQEREAIDEFEHQKEDINSARNKIVKIVKNTEWKKMFFYGSVYENPLASKEGVGEEQTSFDIKARLISQNTYIRGQKELYFGVKFNTAPYTFAVANNISAEIVKPQIDLSASENVEKSEVLYPIPLNAGNYQYIHKYFGEFMLPIKIIVQDVNKPVVVRAKTKIFSCDNDLNCTPSDFDLELPLQPDGEEVLSNGYKNYFNVSLAQMPAGDREHVTLKKFAIDTDKENYQLLRLEFVSDKKINNFKIFVEAKNDIVLFEPPLISLQDKKVYVRLIPKENRDTLDMADMEFTISAVLNNRFYYRKTTTASITSDFDAEAVQLNLGLLWLAFLGGLILNFMPCVFPVISLKMMAFSKVKAKQRKQLKRDLQQTVAGIFSGFTLLIFMLWGAKYTGYSLGWGMQFQNMGFLVVMTFVVTSIIVALPVLNFNDMTLPNLGKYSGFIIGNLAVLLATPCTGPYLATAVGFALSGGYGDILLMMYGVALGLSAPYLLILTLKQPETFFPKSGPWMHKLDIFMRIMLYLTVAWFMLLIFEQTDIYFVLKFVLVICVFVAVVSLVKKFLEYIDGVMDENIPQEAIIKIRRGCYMFMLAVFILCSWICTNMAQTGFKLNYEKNMQNRLTFIDKDLINKFLREGHPVLVEISADWCLTCQMNKFLLFTESNMENLKKSYDLEFLRVDWTNYNKEILEYMGKYGRKGLPFYILYTPFIKEGMVLPEIFEYADLSKILQTSNMR